MNDAAPTFAEEVVHGAFAGMTTQSWSMVWFGIGLLIAAGIHLLARRLTGPSRVTRRVLAPLVVVERAVDDALHELERVQDARLREVRQAIGGTDVSLSDAVLFLSRFPSDASGLYGLSFERALALGPRFAYEHQNLVESMRAWDLHAEQKVSIDEALTRLARLVDALALVTAELDERALVAAREKARDDVLHAIVAALPDDKSVLH